MVLTLLFVLSLGGNILLYSANNRRALRILQNVMVGRRLRGQIDKRFDVVSDILRRYASRFFALRCSSLVSKPRYLMPLNLLGEAK